jgi:hypothetical protein
VDNRRKDPTSWDVEGEGLSPETQPMRTIRHSSSGGRGGLSDRLRHASGMTVAVIGIGAVVFVIALLVGLIALIVQHSGQTVSVAPSPTLLIEFATPVPGATRALASRRTPAASVISATAAATNAVSLPTAPAGTISPGAFVEVKGTGTLGVRLRTGPGLNYTTDKVADEGTRFKVLEGPRQADEFDWWRLQTKDGAIGWAAGTYLRLAAGFE